MLLATICAAETIEAQFTCTDDQGWEFSYEGNLIKVDNIRKMIVDLWMLHSFRAFCMFLWRIKASESDSGDQYWQARQQLEEYPTWVLLHWQCVICSLPTIQAMESGCYLIWNELVILSMYIKTKLFWNQNCVSGSCKNFKSFVNYFYCFVYSAQDHLFEPLKWLDNSYTMYQDPTRMTLSHQRGRHVVGIQSCYLLTVQRTPRDLWFWNLYMLNLYIIVWEPALNHKILIGTDELTKLVTHWDSFLTLYYNSK